MFAKSKVCHILYLIFELEASFSKSLLVKAGLLFLHPVSTFDKLCRLLDTTPAEMMGNVPEASPQQLPEAFDNVQDAMEFLFA